MSSVGAQRSGALGPRGGESKMAGGLGPGGQAPKMLGIARDGGEGPELKAPLRIVQLLCWGAGNAESMSRQP